MIAIGRIGRSPEAELVARYQQRLGDRPRLTELGDGKTPPAKPAQTRDIVLDEKGQALSSEALAALLQRWQTDGVREARFLIGGADGHDAATRATADLVMSFGPATWPHLLVRAMLAEQLYRAQTILTAHPYHRSG